MKLCDLVKVMDNNDSIALYMDVSGIIFEADVKPADIPMEMALLDIIRVYAYNDQVKVVLAK